MAQILVYHMTGQLPQPPYTAVFWNVFGQPDPTGAQSGYGAGYLINVAIVYASIDGSPIDPVSGQVGGDLTGYLPNPYVSGLQGKPISTTAPTSGQVLQYNGTQYVPTTVAVPSEVVGGDLSGTLPNPSVVKIQGQAVSASAPSSNQLLNWNGSAWIGASVGGDISGAISSTTVDKIKGQAVSASAPSFGQSLTWTGSQWGGVSPGGDVTGSSIATLTVSKIQGSAVSASPPISGAPLTWNGTAWVAVSLAGDVTGSVGTNSIDKLQGVALIANSPTLGQIIAYDGTRWTQTTPSIPIATTATSSPTADTIALRDSNGATQFASTANNSLTIGAGLLAAQTNTAFGLSQTARSTDAVTNDITFTSQAPFASATGANRLPGDVIFTIPTAAGALATTNSGTVKFNFSGTDAITMYSAPSTGVGIIEFPSGGALAEVLNIQSSTSLGLFISSTLDLFGTPINLTSNGGAITLTADTGISLSSLTTVGVNATTTLDLYSGGNYTIDSASNGSVKCDGNLTIQSSSGIFINDNTTGSNIEILSTNSTTLTGSDSVITLDTTGLYINDNAGNGITIASGGGGITFNASTVIFDTAPQVTGLQFPGGDGSSYTIQPVTTGGMVNGAALVVAGADEGVSGVGGDLTLASGAGGASTGIVAIKAGATNRFRADNTGIGFYTTAPIAKPTVTGSKAGNAALASLLTALSNLGLVTDSSS